MNANCWTTALHPVCYCTYVTLMCPGLLSAHPWGSTPTAEPGQAGTASLCTSHTKANENKPPKSDFFEMEYSTHQPLHLEVLQTIIRDLQGCSSMQTDMSKPHQPCASAGHRHPQQSQNYPPACCKQDKCWKQSSACGSGRPDATQSQLGTFKVWCSFTCCSALCWKHTRYLKWKYIPFASL